MKRFHGNLHTVTTLDQLLSAEVPSDWSLSPQAPGSASLAVADWAGTGMVTVTSDVPFEQLVSAEQLETSMTTIRDNLGSKSVPRLGPFECGKLCIGERYIIDQKGSEGLMLVAVKGDGHRLLLINAVAQEDADQKQIDTLLAIVRSTRVTNGAMHSPRAGE